MAHYYRVLSQEEKSSEVPQFYANDENQTVQYVIASDSQQQFQQPVVVSSEQVMVVDGQAQPVIIEQAPYQPSQYVIQDSTIDFQNTQQVYYMANTPSNQSVIVEQPIQQPVVLNHQMMQNQNVQVAKTQGVVGNRGVQKAQMQTYPQEATNEDENVTLADGTVITVSQYRKVISQQKHSQGTQERQTVAALPGPHRKINRVSLPLRTPVRNAKPRPNQRVNQRNLMQSSSDDSFEELRGNVKHQYHNQMHVNRQEAQQSQYLIQPRKKDSKPAPPKPLPHFLHSSQIQNIIDSAPKNEEFTDSIRMLVLLENGEQRLITFTLPKEACTIQEILEQVGVPFTKDTPIQVSEANAYGLNYIVAVGNVQGFAVDQNQAQPSPQQPIVEPDDCMNFISTPLIERRKPTRSPPNVQKELPPKLVDGQLAVCAICGYLSEDFNKCMRCKRRLPDNVKSIPAINSNGKKVDPRSGLVEKRLAMQKTNGVPRMNLLPKKRPNKPKLMECETVVVSSDEEGEEKKTPMKNVSEQLLEKLGAAVTISPISKEPSIIDMQKSNMTPLKDKIPVEQINSALVICRTVRIGSYRFVPPEPIRIDSNGLTLKVPHPKSENTIKIIKVDNNTIVKVLISFQKSLPVLFYYVLPSVGAMIRSALDMCQGGDVYFDPLSESEESHRRITLLPETLSEECRQTLQKIYTKNAVLDELTYKEANDILIKTCPKDLSKSVLNYGVSEIKPILMYPPEGRGKITINTEDYLCLGQDQFLNDVIIDFYLKYLLLNLPKEQQEKVYIFSTFFYKRLTTKPMKASRKSQPTEIDPNLTAAEKRHCRVKTWTKNVNLFEKDFIVVPINENAHWFLAIICFPSMNGSQTMDGKAIKIEPRQKQRKKKKDRATVEQAIMCEEGELSDKDEAEGDESELDSDDSEEAAAAAAAAVASPPPPTVTSVENNAQRPPIKQPCILIFDSLAGASRSRVVATLRDYLTCEYKAKMNEEKIFTKDVIKGACPKVPQQTNFTDCGLYLLQYVEQFFKDPIKDYYIPISHLKNWFEEITVTKKREDISILIQGLMKEAGRDLDVLPDVTFPTLNGELTERALAEKDDKFIDPDDDYMEDEDESYTPPPSKSQNNDTSSDSGENTTEKTSCPSPSCDSVKMDAADSKTVNSAPLMTPNVSELPKQTSNRDTLSYLKAKRIIRHKNNANSDGGPDMKKLKCVKTTTGT